MIMIDINDLTLAQIKEIMKLAPCANDSASPTTSHPYKVGEKYLIRTVTLYYTGRLIAVYQNEIVLEDAAWIPDTGRYANCLEDGKFNEIEPIKGNLIIGRGSIIDCVNWKYNLPRDQK